MSAQLLPVCGGLSCRDVEPPIGRIPYGQIDPARVRIILVSETQPLDPAEGYYAQGNPLFGRTTVAAFNDAGIRVSSVADIIEHGVYLTTAVKCAKTAPGVDPATVVACAPLLQRELEQFPNARVVLLMGDVAIRALNEVARRVGEPRVVPAGATYRIRGGDYRFRGMHVLPSYLQAGPAFFIEKSKRQMIAEDIRRAFDLVAEEAGVHAAAPA